MARACQSSESLLPEAVDELPTQHDPSPFIHYRRKGFKITTNTQSRRIKVYKRIILNKWIVVNNYIDFYCLHSYYSA